MKLKNIEIAIATIVLLFAVYTLCDAVSLYVNGGFTANSFDRNLFEAKGLHFNFYINYLLPFILLDVTIYASFIWIACSLPNKLIAQKQWGKAALAIVGSIALLWGAMVYREYQFLMYQDNILPRLIYNNLGTATAVTMAFLAYVAFKHFSVWLLNRDHIKAGIKLSPIRFDLVWFGFVWGLAMAFVVFVHPYWGIGLFLSLMVPCIFITYLVCLYWLIPRYYQKVNNNQFWLITGGATLAVNLPLNGAFIAISTNNTFVFIVLFLIFWVMQVMILFPVSLYIHKIRKERAAELTGLQTELGTSKAGLQFLRSQINPHFLFNALNTLYGTALMEHAEKTGEGIQKLGDMMRFMLHENNQDKIALSRELDYLHNYIDLQNMRIAASDTITLEIQIEDIMGYYEIAPMLLIPFIENAYKHGISLKEKSWINVNLFKRDNLLHLDVHNSIQPVNENDPERYHSGTGLANVKQRLQLIYPDQHELVIRQNTKEFFIHLSLTLHIQNPD